MTNLAEAMRVALEAGRLPEAPLKMPVQKLAPVALTEILRAKLEMLGRKAES